MSTINQRIREVRKQSGLSMKKFSAPLGISDAAISNIENGKNIPSQSTIRAICSVYSVNRNWLETGQGQMLLGQDDAMENTILTALAGQSEIKKQLMLFVAELPDELLDDLLKRLKNL